MKRLVVKVGTSTLTGAGGSGLDRVFINSLAAQIAEQRSLGQQIVLVTSGAIRAGMAGLGMTERPRTIPAKQAVASVGQGLLMALYADIFANYGISVGQILLTGEDLRNRARYVNARNTFEALFTANVLPIVNENDTVAVDEIKVGDNDTLAALVASLIDAGNLLLLSDVDGLFDKNPSLHPDARVVERVERLNAAVIAMAGGAQSTAGTGGMRTKLAAAEIATTSGAAMWIANGRKPRVIAACLSNQPGAGTYFAPAAIRPSARKRWLAWASGTPAGTVVVNKFARHALQEEGRSLLPVGVIGARGAFEAGDLVGVADEAGEIFARGLTCYGSADVNRIAGIASSELKQVLSASGGPRDEVIHRDSLVLLSLMS